MLKLLTIAVLNIYTFEPFFLHIYSFFRAFGSSFLRTVFFRFVNFISCLLPFVSFVYVPVIVAALSLPLLSVKTYRLRGFSLFFSTTTSVIFLLFMS